jgi:hypothetical protein
MELTENTVKLEEKIDLKRCFFVNGEHGRIYEKVLEIEEKLSNKIDKTHKESIKEIIEIKRELAEIRASLGFLPCKSHSERIKNLEMRIYMAIGAVALIILLNQLGII